MSESRPQPGATKPAARAWTVLELLRWTTDHFASQGLDTPRLDAEVLLAHALVLRRLDLYLQLDKPVGAQERERFRELIRRRVDERVPVSILVGRREFWSRSFRVSPDVLTPRPETESLIQFALDILQVTDFEYKILDVGTGSGALAITLAAERTRSQVTATDLSGRALQIARQNAEELHVADRVRFLEGNLFEPVLKEQFDLIISNPPYLCEREAGVYAPELAHEPAMALFAGPDGLAVIHPLIAGLTAHLKPGGWSVIEFDPSQAEKVEQSASEAGLAEVQILLDLAQRKRAVVARKPLTAGVAR